MENWESAPLFKEVLVERDALLASGVPESDVERQVAEMRADKVKELRAELGRLSEGHSQHELENLRRIAKGERPLPREESVEETLGRIFSQSPEGWDKDEEKTENGE